VVLCALYSRIANPGAVQPIEQPATSGQRSGQETQPGTDWH